MISDLLVTEPDELFVSSYTGLTYQPPNLMRDLRSISNEVDNKSLHDLVHLYYDLQTMRLQVAKATRTLDTHHHRYQLMEYYATQLHALEVGLVRPIHDYTQRFIVGRWALAQYGIGPILAGGLLAHIDITKAKTAGSIWRYAGLDPTVRASKDAKRPWNPELKTLTWKIGFSFARHADNPDCFYGQLYRIDKERRTAKNQAGDYAATAADTLRTQDHLDSVTRTALSHGQLPDTQIDAQARRFAVKIFLSHYHAVAYQDHYNTVAPRPYIIENGTESVEISIPHFPFSQDV